MADLPSPPSSSPAAYRFGPFVVDPLRRLVWRNTGVVALPGKTFDLLLLLIEHRGRILEKEELLALLWPDAIVQENNLVRQISNLRRALGQRPEQHDFIVTVSGRGYGFVATVLALDRVPREFAGANAAFEEAVPDPTEPSTSVPVPVSVTPPAALKATAWTLTNPTGWAVLGAAFGILLIVAYSLRPAPLIGAPRGLSQLTYDAGLQNGATWSPDGQRLAYSADLAGNADIWTQSTADPTPVRVSRSDAADWQPSWSPDGRRIAFRSERKAGGLYTVPAGGGDEARVTTFGYRPSWSPDGRMLLFVDIDAVGPKQSLYVVAANGGAPRRVRPDLTDAFRTITASWHPDGRVSLLAHDEAGIAFVTLPVEAGPAVRSLLSSEVASRLGGLSLGRFVWSRSQRFLFLEGHTRDTANIWRIAVDPASLAWTSAERLTTTTGRDADLALSADGSKLAFSSLSETTRLWALPYDAATGLLTGDPQPVTSGGPGEFDAAVPPDGTRVAYRTERISRLELWERPLAGGAERLLTIGDSGKISSPRWSRDAARLAFMRAESTGNTRSLGILTVAGNKEVRLRIPESELFIPDDWSPDDTLILGACRLAGQSRLGACVTSVAAPDGEVRATLLAADPNRNLICPRFSPDQHWISFMAADGRRSNVSTLYVMPAAGGTWVPITAGTSYDDKPRWSGDGRTIFFVSNRGGLLNLWARHFDPVAGTPVGEPFQVTYFDDLRRTLPSRLASMEIGVSRDRIFLPISETTGRIWMLDRADR